MVSNYSRNETYQALRPPNHREIQHSEVDVHVGKPAPSGFVKKFAFREGPSIHQQNTVKRSLEDGGPGQSRTADQRFRKRPLLREHNNLACDGACPTAQFMAVVADTEHLSEHKKQSPPREYPAVPKRMLGFASRTQQGSRGCRVYEQESRLGALHEGGTLEK